ncbi:hypothetical protein LWI28_021545 [Acer negundo]|uniref:F-box domain-containing protein n=1 Tax=Acer negundo TaxID=4023 RepID=A0AAD5IFF2_ACENE|nr:hypothetical protein LWI28_021545 [Acer negundo]
MKKIKVEEVDWISGLLDSMLHHIFSFLPFKQVVQTCVLSKRWEELWLSYPSVLEFDRCIFDDGLRDPWHSNIYIETNEYERRAKEFFSGLVKNLRKRLEGKETMSTLKKFALEMYLFNDFELKSLLDRCISYAVGCNVKELKLIFNCSSTCIVYNLRQVIFSVKSIEVLELKGWKLELPRRSKVKLSSLRKLILIGVYASDYMMKNLIDGCPLIETLSFSACSGFKSVDASGLSKLNEIKLTNNHQLGKVTIEESNVHILSIGGDICSGFCQDLVSLSLSDIPIMDGWLSSAISENLKSLSLSDIFITNEWLCDQIFKLRFLEYLSLDKCFICSYFLEISSRCLKTLMILGCLELHELMIDTPNLHIFEYRGGMVSVTLNVLDLSKISLHLCGPRFETRWYQDFVFEQTQWYIKYIEFLAKLNDFLDLLHLQIELGEVCMILLFEIFIQFL